jgi:hypothetical protein
MGTLFFLGKLNPPHQNVGLPNYNNSIILFFFISKLLELSLIQIERKIDPKIATNTFDRYNSVTMYIDIQWNLCDPTPEFSDIL